MLRVPFNRNGGARGPSSTLGNNPFLYPTFPNRWLLTPSRLIIWRSLTLNPNTFLLLLKSSSSTQARPNQSQLFGWDPGQASATLSTTVYTPLMVWGSSPNKQPKFFSVQGSRHDSLSDGFLLHHSWNCSISKHDGSSREKWATLVSFCSNVHVFDFWARTLTLVKLQLNVGVSVIPECKADKSPYLRLTGW